MKNHKVLHETVVGDPLHIRLLMALDLFSYARPPPAQNFLRAKKGPEHLKVITNCLLVGHWIQFSYTHVGSMSSGTGHTVVLSCE